MPWRLFHSTFGDYRAGTLVEYPTGVWAGFPPEAMDASIQIETGAGGRLHLPSEIMDAIRERRGGSGVPCAAPVDPISPGPGPHPAATEPPRRRPDRPRRSAQ